MQQIISLIQSNNCIISQALDVSFFLYKTLDPLKDHYKTESFRKLIGNTILLFIVMDISCRTVAFNKFE